MRHIPAQSHIQSSKCPVLEPALQHLKNLDMRNENLSSQNSEILEMSAPFTSQLDHRLELEDQATLEQVAYPLQSYC